MDLYLGDLTPSQIAEEVLSQLQSEVIHSQNAYQNWVKENGGFRMVSISRDESQWVLRMGEEPGRFIHLHPGRNSPRTRRVRANTLRTAILVCAYLQVEPRPLEVSLVNQVRQQYLGLSPVGKMKGEEGLVSVIKDLLK